MGKSKVLIENFKKSRKNLGFTQQSLADLSGVSVSTIKQIEAGRSGTTLEKFKVLADTLNVSLKEIYREDYRETLVITVLNNNCRCSKTTVVQNLGYELSQKGYKVLIVDSDIKCKLSYIFDFNFENSPNFYDAVVNTTIYNPIDIFKYIIRTEYKNLDMIGNVFEAADINSILDSKSFRETIIKSIFKPLIEEGKYDFIIFDCNPELEIKNRNILLFTDYVIIPIVLEFCGVMGINVLLNYIEKMKKENNKLSVLGILKTKIDKRRNIKKNISKHLIDLKEEYNVKIFKNYIPIDINIELSQNEKVPLGVYIKRDKIRSRARDSFISLSEEILKKLDK